MTLRRKTWAGNFATAEDVEVYGVTEGYLSVELVEGASPPKSAQVTFSDAQLSAAGWPGPPIKLDELIIDDGQVRTITAVETKYLGPQVLVYVAEVQSLSYDRLIRLERGTTTTNDYGEEIATWGELATVVASKTDLSGDEKTEALQTSALVVTRFRIPWSAAVASLSPLDRVVYPAIGGRIYNIQAVKELQLRVGLEILATGQADAPNAGTDPSYEELLGSGDPDDLSPMFSSLPFAP